jgi:glutamate synthase domain-containing protein 2/glutamate synthase domain-containing protein 1/glutamate synthase domain-containing protein 3
MKTRGLYDPRHERGSCGVGFVADVAGRRRHRILEMALEALVNLTHRGAVAADGLTGDGAGVQTQLPYKLLRRELAAQGRGPVRDEDLAVGVVFLPAGDAGARARAAELVAAAVEEGGLRTLAWRRVPLGLDALGEIARRRRPDVWQVLVARPPKLTDDAFDRRLYLTRRRLTRRAGKAGLAGFYVPSFSRRTVVYKGLMIASQLPRFYPDLADPDFETAVAVFHQRYSTNTEPDWVLAQPFRLLAHNGEINTLNGNVNWMKARERELESAMWGERIEELLPVIQDGGSDSAMLDNTLEFLTLFGRDPLQVLRMLIPEAERPDLEPDVRAFYDYHATLMEPWDGPAAVVLCDGRYAAAILDRNGLRPERFWETRDGVVILGSEAGIVAVPDADVTRKGRLGPGQMLAVDTREGVVAGDDAIKRRCARRRPYRAWLKRRKVDLPSFPDAFAEGVAAPGLPLAAAQLAFGYCREDLERVIRPMLETAREPVGSMGDDTPLAALSAQPQLLYRYFKQRFAQVTNPPIDPLRERLVMSLRTMVGPWGCVTGEYEELAHLIDFPSPIIGPEQLDWLLGLPDRHFSSAMLDVTFPARGKSLREAVDRLVTDAEDAVDGGATILVLSDRGVSAGRAPIPMLLATGAIHEHLVEVRKRMQTSLVCDTGEPREDHHFACLIGYGATLVHPWLAYASATELAADAGLTAQEACERYRQAVEKGLLKIMSKLGVGPVASYQGAQLFEAIGLDPELVDRYFTGTESRLGGVGLDGVAADVLAFHGFAFPAGGGEVELPDRGLFRYRQQGEYHALNPPVFKALHQAVRTGSAEAYERYGELVDGRPPCNVRDLLRWKRAAEPLDVGEVEPAAEIAKRFSTGAMSHGALSREAHEVLAVAMNRLGARSGSGEGGEDRRRFYPYEDDPEGVSVAAWRPRKGDWGSSAIKQVASGRFGVTPEYLVSAREIEIKMAQGSKPGEGGQIPGHKVSVEIARQRHAVPGVSLISPPPHHDIYSIEDLAQLIYDLKRVNPEARVAVKLVSTAGVGTIAAGVAKGWADCIQISGADGGTGASPLSSIRHAGLPWELGLAETQQVLVANRLRERVRLRVDGGLKTGRDVVLAALLGAEEFGFGTSALVAVGCIMARQCHLDTCPVGVASQREELRRRFPGKPEHLISFLLFVAEQVRRILAELGLRRLADAVGRTDLLEVRDVESPKGVRLDLEALLYDPDPAGTRPRRCLAERNDPPAAVNFPPIPPEGAAPPLDDVLWRDGRGAIDAGEPLALSYPITNRDRTVGARLSGEIARRTRGEGLPEGTVDARFRGAAGQSFGAFLERGLRLTLEGEAQDYVGKGMHGGEIVLRPPAACPFPAHDNVIAGNTLLYGATGGRFFAAGLVGERFAVRNSGCEAVVEGCGDHGCEYMTRGTVVVLGPTGRNFAAGMSGGAAYVLDASGVFPRRVNTGMVEIGRLGAEDDADALRRLVARHREVTGSVRAAGILERWDDVLPSFWKVSPAGVDDAAPAGVRGADAVAAAPGVAAARPS